MSRYDGLIIPRSYSEYINKTDAATLSQALQLNNALDDTPTEDSRGGVRSGGVFDALAGKQPTLTFDDTPTDGSANPVKSDGIYDALATKQNTLTFDDTPTASSNNPVTSNGIYTEFGKLGKQTLLYNGNTYDGTTKQLNESIKNYRYLYIGLITNSDYDYILVPTANIQNGSSYSRTMMMASATGQITLPFSYQSSIKVTIETETSFNAVATYNNVNWILKVYAIWGVN